MKQQVKVQEDRRSLPDPEDLSRHEFKIVARRIANDYSGITQSQDEAESDKGNKEKAVDSPAPIPRGSTSRAPSLDISEAQSADGREEAGERRVSLAQEAGVLIYRDPALKFRIGEER